MKKLKMRRIDLKDQAGQLELDNLMSALGNQGNVVSPKGRELTKAVFGEAPQPSASGRARLFRCSYQRLGFATSLHQTIR